MIVKPSGHSLLDGMALASVEEDDLRHRVLNGLTLNDQYNLDIRPPSNSGGSKSASSTPTAGRARSRNSTSKLPDHSRLECKSGQSTSSFVRRFNSLFARTTSDCGSSPSHSAASSEQVTPKNSVFRKISASTLSQSSYDSVFVDVKSSKNNLGLPSDSPHNRSTTGSPVNDCSSTSELLLASPNRSDSSSTLSPFNRLLRTRKTSKSNVQAANNCALTPIDEQHQFFCADQFNQGLTTTSLSSSSALASSPRRQRLANSTSLGERHSRPQLQPTRSHPTQTETPGRTRRTGCFVPNPSAYVDLMDQPRGSNPTLSFGECGPSGSGSSNGSPKLSVRNSDRISKKTSAPAMHPYMYERTMSGHDTFRLTQSVNSEANNDTNSAAANSTSSSGFVDDASRQQKKKSTENLIKTFKFLKRVSTDITIWKNKTGIKSQQDASLAATASSIASICTCNQMASATALNDGHSSTTLLDQEQQLFGSGLQNISRLPETPCAVHSARNASAFTSLESKSPTSLTTAIPRYAKCLEQHRPSSAEIKSWGSSFQALLNHPCGLDLFREFLRSEFSDENIDFWIACEQYKQSCEDSNDSLRQKAYSLFELFLLDQATKEVNLDSETRQMTTSRLEGGCIDVNMFAEAQQRIYTLMEKDSYRRFLRSDVYRYILQEHCDASSASSDEKTVAVDTLVTR